MKRSRLEIELKQLGSISNLFLSETVQAGGGMNKPAAGRATISASQCGCAKGPGWLTERKHLMMSRLGGGGQGRQVKRSADIRVEHTHLDTHFPHCAHKQDRHFLWLNH